MLYFTTDKYHNQFEINYNLTIENNYEEYIKQWAFQQICILCEISPNNKGLSIETIKHDFSPTVEWNKEMFDNPTDKQQGTVMIFKYITTNTESLINELICLGFLECNS